MVAAAAEMVSAVEALEDTLVAATLEAAVAMAAVVLTAMDAVEEI